MSGARPILLVEDNPMDVELTLVALKRRGMAIPVEVARDGAEALAWIARWKSGDPKPVLILLDVNLPRVGGLEVLRQFKSDECSRAIPVVMLTTSDVEKEVEAAYDLGANSYIVKPVDFDRFTALAGHIERYWLQLNLPAAT